MESIEDILNKIKDPKTREELEKIVKFHGYLSSGACIGYQMLNIARKQLNIKEGEKIFVTAETQNCLPDPFQILLGSTTGTKRLTVKDYGKMAVTVNKAAAPEEHVKGIRIFLDPKKTEKYPKLHAWYMNYEKVPHEEVWPLLVEAGEDLYSWEFIDLEVQHKKKKNVIICKKCGEAFISWDNNDICTSCSHKT